MSSNPAYRTNLVFADMRIGSLSKHPTTQPIGATPLDENCPQSKSTQEVYLGVFKRMPRPSWPSGCPSRPCGPLSPHLAVRDKYPGHNGMVGGEGPGVIYDQVQFQGEILLSRPSSHLLTVHKTLPSALLTAEPSSLVAQNAFPRNRPVSQR